MVDITDRDRDAFHDQSAPRSGESVTSPASQTTFSLVKVFLYMFAGLLITAAVAFGVGAAVYYGIVVKQAPNEVGTPYLVACFEAGYNREEFNDLRHARALRRQAV